MEDQICSPEKYWITNFYDKKIRTEYKYILIE